MEIKFKKRIRLKNFDYQGTYKYFVTLCAFNKADVFKDKKLVAYLVDELKRTSEISKFKIWAYCFMPDHGHLLIEGMDKDSDMKKFISVYKQKTGFFYKKSYGKKLWQINYYEHVLRKDESVINVAKYVWENPVRKGLVEDYRKYEFNGSFELNINHI